jgi:serine/threonine protein phosphatase PrpC
MMQQGLLAEEEIYTHEQRNQIYRSLGISEPVAVDAFHAQLTPGSMLVLCCDGLWEMLRSEGIDDVLMLGLRDPQAICDELVRRANEAGGVDNISVIVVRAQA